MNADHRRPEEFRGDVELAIAIFVCSDRRFEVARIGEAIGANGPEFRQPERQAVVLADVSARLLLCKHDAELDTARDDADLARRNFENAELGVEPKRPQLRNDQHFAIGRVEEAILHRRVGGVEMNRQPDLHRRIAIAAERHDAVDEVSLLVGNRQRIPAQLVGRGGHLDKRAAADQSRAGSLRRGDA